jgi:WD40 repeat protein
VGHERLINDIQYDKQSGFIATASDDQTVRLWKTDKHVPYHEFRNHMAAVRAIAFQPQTEVDAPTRVLASASYDGTVCLYDIINLSLLYTIGNPIHNFPGDRISCVSWSPDGKYLCTGDSEGVVGVWEWRESAEPRPFALWAPERIREDEQESLPNGMNGHKEDGNTPVCRIHWQKNGQSFVVCRQNRKVLFF